MRECDNSKIHISSNFLLSICLIIMLDTLLIMLDTIFSNCAAFVMVAVSVAFIDNMVAVQCLCFALRSLIFTLRNTEEAWWRIFGTEINWQQALHGSLLFALLALCRKWVISGTFFVLTDACEVTGHVIYFRNLFPCFSFGVSLILRMLFNLLNEGHCVCFEHRNVGSKVRI